MSREEVPTATGAGAKTLYLKEWWEVVGVLKGIREKNGILEVYIDCHGVAYKLVFQRDSTEATRLREDLQDHVGGVVAILKTDLGDVPLVTRFVDGF